MILEYEESVLLPASGVGDGKVQGLALRFLEPDGRLHQGAEAAWPATPSAPMRRLLQPRRGHHQGLDHAHEQRAGASGVGSGGRGPYACGEPERERRTTAVAWGSDAAADHWLEWGWSIFNQFYRLNAN